MYRRTKALDISPAVRKAVWERDGGRCVLCLSPEAAPNAHYIARSHGGLGIEQNLVTLCSACHHRYDNTPDRPYIREELKAYLMSRYEDWDQQNLIYKKGKSI